MKSCPLLVLNLRRVFRLSVRVGYAPFEKAQILPQDKMDRGRGRHNRFPVCGLRLAGVKKQTEIYGLVYESRKSKNFFLVWLMGLANQKVFSVWFDELPNQKLLSGFAEKFCKPNRKNIFSLQNS